MSDTNDDTAKAFGYLVIFLLLPAIMLAPSLYIAFVAQHYWQWFIEPSFAVACPPLFRMTGLVLAVFAIGLGYAVWLRTTKPAVYAEIGRTVMEDAHERSDA